MRRLTLPRQDDGAVAVMTALLALVLFGMAALVVDAGAFYAERRELQNGADAAALAVAADCATGACGAYATTSGAYADANAIDEQSGVEEVCGSVSPLPLCGEPPEAAAGHDFVRVRTLTDDGAGGDEVPWVFGTILEGDEDGTTVHAEATVVWGAPSSLESAVPVTMSACEWEAFTSDGAALAPPPDYGTHPGLGYTSAWLTGTGPTYERVFHTHDTSKDATGVATECPATPPGGDAAGSFGWLSDTDSSCSVTTTVDGDGDPGYENQPGNTVPSVCKKADFPQPGDLVHLPVYDHYTVKGNVAGKGGGQEVWYHLAGYAALYVTGNNVQLPGGEDKKSIVTGALPCTGQARCISGFFTAGLAPASGVVGSGPSFGTSLTQLVD